MLARGVRLAERRVLRVAGEDALKLLQGLVTNDVRGLAEPGAPPVYAAVLGANGRVAHDAFFHREMGEGPSGGALLADLPAATFEDAVKLLESHGVAVEEGPVPRPAADGEIGRSVYFRDPDGNLLELLSTV